VVTHDLELMEAACGYGLSLPLENTTAFMERT
jgi:hypothetical protein